jgi:HAD superfamily hydrolase (TIGR01509 family)
MIPMTSPRAIIFDLGKVLLEFDYGIAIRRFLPRCRVDFGTLHRVLTQDHLLIEYETGLRTTPEFYAALCRLTGYAGELGEFREMFGSIFTPIEPMVTLLGEIRARGLPAYLFSNTNELAIEFVRAQFPFMSAFTGQILSYEVKAMKPAPPMYELAERLSGFRGPELFYIDDRSENVEAGWQRGWQGIVHHDPAETRAALVRLGVLNPKA